MWNRLRPPGAMLSLALAAWCPGCQPLPPQATGAVERFIAAVQAEDLDTLFCALAGASSPDDDAEQEAARRQSFEQWAMARYAVYEQGRDEGWVDFEGDGIVLTKAFALGKGTFYSLRASSRDAGRVEVEMSIRFAYDAIDISGLPPGSVFYVSGAEPGRVHPLRIPYGPGSVSAEVLETLDVRWNLVRVAATPSCPAGWAIASVEPLPGTATTTEVTWVF